MELRYNMHFSKSVIFNRRTIKIIMLCVLSIIILIVAASNSSGSPVQNENPSILASNEIITDNNSGQANDTNHGSYINHDDNINQNTELKYISLINETEVDYSEDMVSLRSDEEVIETTDEYGLPELTNFRLLASSGELDTENAQDNDCETDTILNPDIPDEIDIPEWRTLPYLIHVSLDTFTIAILELDENGDHTKLVHTWRTAYGRTNAQTRPGIYSIRHKTPWIAWRNGYFSPFGSNYTGNLWFHAPLYNRKNLNTLRASTYNQIGTRASAGCFRTSSQAAAWIYYNVPVGTRVIVSNDSFFTSPEHELIDPRQTFDPSYPVDQEPLVIQELTQDTGVDYPIIKICD